MNLALIAHALGDNGGEPIELPEGTYPSGSASYTFAYIHGFVSAEGAAVNVIPDGSGLDLLYFDHNVTLDGLIVDCQHTPGAAGVRIYNPDTQLTSVSITNMTVRNSDSASNYRVRNIASGGLVFQNNVSEQVYGTIHHHHLYITEVNDGFIDNFTASGVCSGGYVRLKSCPGLIIANGSAATEDGMGYGRAIVVSQPAAGGPDNTTLEIHDLSIENWVEAAVRLAANTTLHMYDCDVSDTAYVVKIAPNFTGAFDADTDLETLTLTNVGALWGYE